MGNPAVISFSGVEAAPYDFNYLAQTSLAVFSVTGVDGYFRDLNPALENLLGYPREHLLARSFLEFVHPEDIAATLKGLAEIQDEARETTFENRWLAHDGSTLWLSWVARHDPDAQVWFGTARDVTHIRHRQTELQDYQRRITLALSVAQAGSWEWAEDEIHVDANTRSLLRLPRHSNSHSIAKLLRAVHPGERAPVIQSLRQIAHGEDAFDIHFRLKYGTAVVRHVALRGRVLARGRNRAPERATGLAFDVTLQKTVEEQLQNLVIRDPLTGLYNRRRFEEALDAEWQRGLRTGMPLSLLMIDVDEFKLYNDTYGHDAGDEALRCLGRAIESRCIRASDLLARYGGEEFVVLLPEADQDAAESVASRIVSGVRALGLPHWRSVHSQVTVSIGAASVIPAHDRQSIELVRNADQAMYRAKLGGRNRFRR